MNIALDPSELGLVKYEPLGEGGEFPIRKYIWHKYKKHSSTRTLGFFKSSVLDYLREHCVIMSVIGELFDLHRDEKHKISSFLGTYKNCFVKTAYNNFSGYYTIVLYFFEGEVPSFEEDLVEGLKAHLYDKPKTLKNPTPFYFLMSEGGNLDFVELEIETPSTSLELNYGKSFLPVHDRIVELLSDHKTSNGLFMFHGPPGTGKTNYIKYLKNQIERDMIFIPSNMIGSLANPDFLRLLIRHPNSVIILEDAEQALLKREEAHNDTLVSTLLNLSNGIIGSLLNCSIVVTYNTEKENIDPALLRKGRLKIEYKFDLLDMESAQNLIDNLGFHHEATGPMSVADIYNLQEMNFSVPKEKKSMGFLVGKD